MSDNSSYASIYGNGLQTRSIESISNQKNPLNEEYLDQIGSITFLNGLGDITITWEKEQNERMIQMIDEKMQQGYSFFMIEKQSIFKRIWTCLGGEAPGQRKIQNSEDIKNNRTVVIPDEVLESLRKEGLINIIKGSERQNNNETTKTVSRLKKASDIVSNHSIAIAPMRGG